VKALSGSQPWWWAILHAGKRIENRLWSPPRDQIGNVVAMHAAKSFDKAGYRAMILAGVDVPPKDAMPAGVFVGSFRLVGVCEESRRTATLQCACDPAWAAAEQCHWLIDDVVALDAHIPERGQLGLWLAPTAVLRAINESRKAA
jgi:hypothetical protein